MGQHPPGNGAGGRTAPAAKIKGVDFTRGPRSVGLPAQEPSLLIVSLIRSFKAPQQAVGGGGEAATSSADTSCYCGGGEAVSLHSPDAFNMPPAR